MPDQKTDYETEALGRLTSDNRKPVIQGFVKAYSVGPQGLEDALYPMFDLLALPPVILP